MTHPDPKLTTRISTKGQVILPKSIRSKRRWRAGMRLAVEETPEGVVLKPASPFPSTDPNDVFGMLDYAGRPKTVEEMDAAIATEVKQRHARGRY